MAVPQIHWGFLVRDLDFAALSFRMSGAGTMSPTWRLIPDTGELLPQDETSQLPRSADESWSSRWIL